MILLSGFLTVIVNAGPVPSKKGGNVIEITKRDSGSRLAFVNKMYFGFTNEYSSNKEVNDALKMDAAHLARKIIKENNIESLVVENYVVHFYKGMLFRKYDDEGFKFWKNIIKSGSKTKYDVFRDFVYSKEFRLLCIRYDFPRGNI